MGHRSPHAKSAARDGGWPSLPKQRGRGEGGGRRTQLPVLSAERQSSHGHTREFWERHSGRGCDGLTGSLQKADTSWCPFKNSESKDSLKEGP